MLRVRVVSGRARSSAPSAEVFERELLSFCNSAVRWLDVQFPEQRDRGATQKGSWDDDGSPVLMLIREERSGGRGFEIVTLLRTVEQTGTVRINALGLAGGSLLEARWNFSATPDVLTGISVDLTANGAREAEVVSDFERWFGGE
jgi:hypothetical protein